MPKAKLAALVEDFNFYPRHAVDEAHVSQLHRALESGATLPPIIADRKTKRIVDGFHRARAARRFLGDEGDIEVIWKDYKSEAEMLAEAIEANAVHGRRLDKMDQVRAVILAEHAGLPKDRIAAVLHIPVQYVEELRLRVAIVASSSEEAVPGTREIALKRSVLHMTGKRMTLEQAEAHRSLPGTSMNLLVMQLQKAITAELLDREDQSLRAELQELVKLITGWLKTKAA